MSTLISFRLDDDAARALRWLQDAGFGRSEAIRKALVSMMRDQQRRQAMADELLALDHDPDDLAERREIGTFMAQFEPGT
ncbi:MAG: hypothetical protein O3A89_11340 [Actinomycetota bacterium]|jgi:Arc/MetJ-type ribon-helix-helix transcriptional regulator|nr:hypothetical protein [Actinomycetota bacterium]MDA3016149.1 hypothetical protein [Actinomycetota bacterium]